jgi:DNA-binding transcriptional LysR family regulator
MMRIEPHAWSEVTPFVLLEVISISDDSFFWWYAAAMELRHLKYFCAVAEHRSFTLAAKQLNVSQSGVSGQVRDLEREMGVSLFRRNQREVALTPEGIIFFDEAKEILLRAERAVELVVRASRGQTGKLILGLCGPVTAPILPKLIRRFRKQFPGVAVALRERTPAEQIDALIGGQIDIGFTRSIPTDLKHLVRHEVLFREPVIVALPKGHRLAAEESVPLVRLASEPIVLYCRDAAPAVFDSIVAMCRKAKFSPKIGETPCSWQSVLTMVEAGEGVALVPECVQYLRANDVVFRPIRDGGCRLDAIVVWRRNESNVLLESFLHHLRAKCAEKATSPAH